MNHSRYPTIESPARAHADLTALCLRLNRVQALQNSLQAEVDRIALCDDPEGDLDDTANGLRDEISNLNAKVRELSCAIQASKAAA